MVQQVSEKVLRIRGDSALLVLQAMQKQMLSMHSQLGNMLSVIDELLKTSADMDMQMGINIGNGNMQQQMLAVLRQQMPHLSNLSDEEILKQFGGV